MFYNSNIDKKQYVDMMAAIKQLNQEKKEYKNSREYNLGKTIKGRVDSVKSGAWVKKLFTRSKKMKLPPNLSTAFNDRQDCNYFSDERIAIYTCIIGKYDKLNEPLFRPDNCDFFAITDFELPEGSMWKRIDAGQFEEISGFSPAMKNRYFKMLPHKVFGEYKYSIYVDGNFRICSDMTEHVNRLSKYGLSCFRHSKRTDSYEEAEACRQLKKETPENIDAYINRLKEAGYPRHYGLLACDILVREHNNRQCISLMEEWWSEFKNYVKRDQLSMPLVLFRNNIAIDDIATLGGDVHQEYSFEIFTHNK